MPAVTVNRALYSAATTQSSCPACARQPAWRSSAATTVLQIASHVSTLGPSYRAGLAVITSLPGVNRRKSRLQQECALHLMRRLCGKVRCSTQPLSARPPDLRCAATRLAQELLVFGRPAWAFP
jgi:hypothetical protein